MTDMPDTRPRHTAGAALQRFADGAVLTRDGDADAVALNPTAMALWELCDGFTSVEEMVSAVCEIFAVDPVTARADVALALGRMRAAGVIT